MEQKRRYAHMHSAASNVHTISVGRLVQHIQKCVRHKRQMETRTHSKVKRLRRQRSIAA
jgi:hypothetical protein